MTFKIRKKYQKINVKIQIWFSIVYVIISRISILLSIALVIIGNVRTTVIIQKLLSGFSMYLTIHGFYGFCYTVFKVTVVSL